MAQGLTLSKSKKNSQAASFASSVGLPSGRPIAEQIVGHDQVLIRFREAIARGHFPHASLFVGPSGIGKKMMAFALAQEICCQVKNTNENSLSTSACGTCGACVRIENVFRLVRGENTKGENLSSQQSESLLFLQPEKNQIRIEQAHQIIEFLNLRQLGQGRVVIIDQVETLNPAAANSILKVLEEPPAETYFFLIAPTPRHVLPTLRSRSQLMHFAPVSFEKMKEVLHDISDSSLRASQGSFERLQLLTEPEEIRMRDLVMAWLFDWSAGDTQFGYLRSDYRDVFRDRAQALRFAGHLLVLMRDLAFYKMGHKQEVFHQEQSSWLEQVAEACELEDLFVATEKAGELVRALGQNLDASLQFEKFWLITRQRLQQQDQ